MLACQFGIGDEDDAIAVDPGDCAGQSTAGAELDVDVMRRRTRCGRYLRAASASARACPRISLALRTPRRPGGNVPRRHSAFAASSGCMPRRMSLSIRSPTPHSARASTSTGMASWTPSTSHGSVKSRARKKPRTGSLKNDSSSATDTSACAGSGNGAEMKASRFGPLAERRLGRQQYAWIKSEGLSGNSQRTGSDVPDIERLQGLGDDDLSPDRADGGAVEGVEDLHQRHRRRARCPGVFVGPGIGDHQLLACRADRVEQQLPVLGTDIALAGHGRRASTSSPSTRPSRGNAPSSSPTRHTTRCGTDRIGTIVHTVNVPVRKFTRVGRPAR